MIEKFRGEEDGCTYCDFREYAVKDHFCQRGKHMGYSKCGWYADPREPQIKPAESDDLTIAYMAGAAAQRDKPGCAICTQGAVRAEYWRKLYAHCPHCGRKLPRIDAKEEGR